MDNIINYTSEIISKNIDLKNETELELAFGTTLNPVPV